MKILLINTSDTDGGAAKAVFRLHKALQMRHIDSNMLVQLKNSDDNTVYGPNTVGRKIISYVRPYIDILPLKLYKINNFNHFTIGWFSNNLIKKISYFKPDIVQLNWIGAGFASIKDIGKITQPIVWRLSDSWAMTGGCHLHNDCERYTSQCGLCPFLKSDNQKDLTFRIIKRKNKYWKKKNISIVCPSKWLAEQVRKSSIFKDNYIEVIPSGIDVNIYKPINKNIAREILNLPQSKKIILFGANHSTIDKNKGYDMLLEVIKNISDYKDYNNLQFIVFGSSTATNTSLKNDNFYHIGKIYDDLTLALYYSAADVFLCLSRFENLPNTILEAMACGTPTVSFDVGGIPEIIDHKQNGYLASRFDIEDFTKGIIWTINDSDRLEVLSNSSRKKIELKFNLYEITKKYIQLYSKILNMNL